MIHPKRHTSLDIGPSKIIIEITTSILSTNNSINDVPSNVMRIGMPRTSCGFDAKGILQGVVDTSK